MASFKDREGTEWQVRLDVPTIEELNADHDMDLANLEKDPLQKLRNDPCVLHAAILVICREQMQSAGLERMEFLKRLDTKGLLEAIQDALIDFFPPGRASHVREVLEKFDQMATKTDELAMAKITKIINDPKVATLLNKKADNVIEEAMKTMTAQGVGT